MIYLEPEKVDPKKHAWLGQGSPSLTIIMSSSAAASVVDELRNDIKELKTDNDMMKYAYESLRGDFDEIVQKNESQAFIIAKLHAERDVFISAFTQMQANFELQATQTGNILARLNEMRVELHDDIKTLSDSIKILMQIISPA